MTSCEFVQAWLSAPTTDLAALPTTISGHVAACKRCRGVLVVALAALYNVPRARPIPCDVCQDELAAYIDTELRAGSTAAAQAYPGVWWHLWMCPDCAETYELTRELASS